MLKPIKLTWLEECDSTSRMLKDKVFGGGAFEEIQVISAASQSQGVGRLGQQWQSIPGNLHYSIAIPAKMIAPELRDILPLAMGGLVAAWVEHEFAVRPCLKWPNDLILDGKKIGGILCEGSIQGDEFAGVVIGVGLNLQIAPQLSDETPYLAGSLARDAGKFLTAKSATESLTEFFRNVWPHLTLNLVMDDWRKLAIGKGHLWFKQGDSFKQLFSNVGINSRGHLQLSEVKWGVHSQKDCFEVSSANHEYKWAPQGCSTFIVADIGNTRTKVARINLDRLKLEMPLWSRNRACSELSESRREELKTQSLFLVNKHFSMTSNAESEDSEQALDTVSVLNSELLSSSGSVAEEAKRFYQTLSQWVSNLSIPVDPIVHVVSVNHQAFESFQKKLSSLEIGARLIERQPVRAVKSHYNLNQIGIDRLSLLEATHYLHVRAMVSYPVMCVSLGTATTVDMVDGAGVHLGGYIAAGMGVALEAIGSKGAQLPKSLEVDSEDWQSLNRWPQNTIEAMTWAPLASTLSFLKSERAKLASHCGLEVEKVPVYLTGGYSEQVAKAWREDQIYHVNDLILLGSGILAANGR